MFSANERVQLNELAITLRRLADNLDVISVLPTGAEAVIVEVLEDARAALLAQERSIGLVQRNIKSSLN